MGPCARHVPVKRPQGAMLRLSEYARHVVLLHADENGDEHVPFDQVAVISQATRFLDRVHSMVGKDYHECIVWQSSDDLANVRVYFLNGRPFLWRAGAVGVAGVVNAMKVNEENIRHARFQGAHGVCQHVVVGAAIPITVAG